MLNMLDGTDKHRTRLAQVVFPAQETVWDLLEWNAAAELLEHRISLRPVSFERDTEILRLRFAETGPDAQVRVKGDLALEPTFGDEKTQVPTDNIAAMPEHIRKFIDGFRPLYNDDPS